MNKSRLATLYISSISILLFLALTLGGTEALAKEQITVLNPQSWLLPYEVKALPSPLDTLSGKNVAVVSTNVPIMKYLPKYLKEAVPDIGEITILGAQCKGYETCSVKDKAKLQEKPPMALIQGIGH